MLTRIRVTLAHDLLNSCISAAVRSREGCPRLLGTWGQIGVQPGAFVFCVSKGSFVHT